MGKDWHKVCLKCGTLYSLEHNYISLRHHSGLEQLRPNPVAPLSELKKNLHVVFIGKCNKVLANGSFLEHEGTPYCEKPCYAAVHGPSGYGRGGGVESHQSFGGGQSELNGFVLIKLYNYSYMDICMFIFVY